MYNKTKLRYANSFTEEQVSRVISGSGITVESELDNDYIVFCPFHGNHRTPAGEIDKVTGMFFCFSCQKHASLPELVMHVSGRTYFEAERFIKSKESGTKDISLQLQKALIVKADYTQYDQLTIKRLNTDALNADRAVSYFSSRLITQESINRFLLGYSLKQDMVTIPVHSPEGMEVGFVGRSIEGKDFKNTPGLPKSKVLFNLHRVKMSSMVYVVESSFDVIRLDQCGFAAVATLGANVSNIQIELLKKYFNNIYVIADNDEAGGNMKDKIIDNLKSRVSVIQLDKKYKDVGDMPDDEIKNLKSSFDKTISSMLK